jgi:hypothetical protein
MYGTALWSDFFIWTYLSAQTTAGEWERMMNREGASMPSLASPLINALLVAIAIGPAISIAKPVYAYIITPTPAPLSEPDAPVILRVKLNKQHFASGDEIRMQVVTSANVVKVSNHELGHGGTLRQVSSGVFTGRGRVSGVPFFLKGMHVSMHYTATTKTGAQVTVTAPVTF